MKNRIRTSSKAAWVEIGDSALLPEKPLISILMLTYNHGPYLAEAIEGVINQEIDFPIELLIGDDHSKDNTLQVAMDYQKRYPNIIRILHAKSNGGATNNLIRLIFESNGEFTAFCEGDDYWIDRNKLSDQLGLIRNNEAISIVHADHVVRHDFWGRKFILHPFGRYVNNLDKKYLVGDISEKCFGELVTHTCTLFCRSKHLKEYLATELVESSGFAYDRCMVNYLALQGDAAYLDRPVSAYRITPGSMMRSGFKGSQKLSIEIRDFFIRFSTQYNKYNDRVERIYKEYTFGILKTSFRLGDQENFEKSVLELKELHLGRGEKITVKWHARLFRYPLIRVVVGRSALAVQAFRNILQMILIYTGIVKRVIIDTPR